MFLQQTEVYVDIIQVLRYDSSLSNTTRYVIRIMKTNCEVNSDEALQPLELQHDNLISTKPACKLN